MSYEYRNKRIIENFVRRYTSNVSDEVDILFELEHVYSQAAKADEYEAKAKAFDRVVEERNQAGTDMYGKDDDVVDRVIERAFWNIDGIIVVYERGGSDD